MKKISKICLASAALLLLWACFDFYHYFVIGTRLTQYYEESDIISRLVGSSLFSAAAKILLAVFAAAVGYRKSRLRKTISSAFAISLLLCISVMGIWLTSMACLTVVTAQEIYDAMYEQSRGFADSIGRYSLLSEFYDKDYSRYHYQYERPDFLEYLILDAIGGHTSSSYHASGHYGSSGSKLIRDLTYNMDTAVLFYDSTSCRHTFPSVPLNFENASRMLPILKYIRANHIPSPAPFSTNAYFEWQLEPFLPFYGAKRAYAFKITQVAPFLADCHRKGLWRHKYIIGFLWHQRQHFFKYSIIN